MRPGRPPSLTGIAGFYAAILGLLFLAAAIYSQGVPS